MQVGALGEDAARELRDLITSGVGSGVSRRVPNASDVGPYLRAAMQRRLDEVAADRDRAVDTGVVWRLVLRAVDRYQQAFADERDYLLAARHLLGRGADPRDATKRAPYHDIQALAESVGMTELDLLHAAGGLKPGAAYGSAISLRRTYAAKVVGLRANRDAFKPGKRTGADEVMRAVRTSLEHVLASDNAIREAVTAGAGGSDSASTTLPEPGMRPGGGRLTGRWFHRWWWIPSFGCVAVLAVIAISLIATSGGTATAQQNMITTHTAAELQQTPGAYWVPANAPIEELPNLTGTCERGSLGAWLSMHGQPQQPIFITISNTHDALVGVTNVVAHGQTHAATPGFWISCNIGGGDIGWDDLALETRDGAVAHFSDGRSNTYFWHSIDPGDTAGISISPHGNLDFTGTVTVDVTMKGQNVQTLTVPGPGKTTALHVTLHGTPPDRMLTVSPVGNGALDCAPPGPASEQPCTVDTIKHELQTLWGLQ
jgi:hypothetical protein